MERVTDKRKKAGNLCLMAAIVIQTFALWTEHAWYELLVPYATLVSMGFLAAVVLCYVNLRDLIRDRDMWLVATGTVIAGINLVLTGSGKGAGLTAADVLLVLYLADKIRFSRYQTWFLCAYTGFYFYYWTFDVKGYFKGYNTNYGGLVLISGFVFAVTGLLIFRKELWDVGEKKGARFLTGFILFMFAWGYNIIAWYRARVALLALVIYALFMLIPAKVWKNKVFFTHSTVFVTVGAIAVSLVYVLAGRIWPDSDIRIFYKDIISGRNLIWADLWGAFLKNPLTGTGSSYRINVDWMEGMFEVHNGLLDILIVHGIIVFAITLFLMIKRLLALREKAVSSTVARSAVAAVFAILAGSFMENFVIVPPFLLLFLALIAIAESV